MQPENFLKKTLITVDKVVNETGGNLNRIICVGGSSNMPQVKQALKKKFPGINVVVSNPEYAVVCGVARCAEKWKPGQGFGGYLASKTALSYGIRSYIGPDSDEEKVFNLIKRGDVLPVVRDHVFTTREDKQSSVRFRVYESHDASDEVELAAFEGISETVKVTLNFGKQVPRHTPVKARLSLDVGGILKVEAIDNAGNTSSAQVSISVAGQEVRVR